MRRLILFSIVGMSIALFIVAARAQAPAGPAFASRMLVNNDRVQIQRLSVNAPHQFLNVGKAPYDVVVVMLK